jgi:hypothetical protein
MATHRVEQSLKYRWGIVGVVLAIAGFYWFAQTSGIIKYHKETIENPNVKILCPRCGGETNKMAECSLCNGKGFLWVDKTKYLPGEITPLP